MCGSKTWLMKNKQCAGVRCNQWRTSNQKVKRRNHVHCLEALRPYEVLPLRTWVDLGALAMKEYSTFPKLKNYWSLTIKLFSVISLLEESYSSAEIQSVYSTARMDQGVIVMKGYSTFPKAPGLEPHHRVYPWHSLLGRSYPLQRYSRHILQPSPTGLIN